MLVDCKDALKYRCILISCSPVLHTVSGLRWGDYLGSPADVLEPKVVTNELIGAHRIEAMTTGEIFGLRASSCVIIHETKSGEIFSVCVNSFAS